MVSNFSLRKVFSLKFLLFLLSTSLVLAFLVVQAQTATITVDVTPSGGTYNSLQDAIDAARIMTNTVKIRVAEGVYREPSSEIDISNAMDLTIEGGWNSTFSNRHGHHKNKRI